MRVFGVNQPDEKPAEAEQGVPTRPIACQVCEYTSEVMAGLEGLFYLEHVPVDTPLAVSKDITVSLGDPAAPTESVRHYVRAVGRTPK